MLVSGVTCVTLLHYDVPDDVHTEVSPRSSLLPLPLPLPLPLLLLHARESSRASGIGLCWILLHRTGRTDIETLQLLFLLDRSFPARVSVPVSASHLPFPVVSHR